MSEDFRKRSNEGRTNSSRHRKREVGRKRSLSSLNVGLDGDDSKWIHRDKLAQIESRELEEAGIRVDRMNTTRSVSSRSSSKRQSNNLQGTESTRNSGDNQAHIQMENWQNRDTVPHMQSRSQEEKWTGTILPLQDSGSTTNPMQAYESQDITEELESLQQRSQARHHVPKNSTSRIPVSKGSPAFNSFKYGERESASQKSRPTSGVWNSASSADITVNPNMRRRSQSVGSQVFLDQPVERINPINTHSLGRPTARTAPNSFSNAVRTSSIRRVSPAKITIGAQEQIQPSNSSSSPKEVNKRPATSAGRLSSGHPRPEGDPPWLASMYKPDPRLPPEQQMIPTHAKRLAQEQWEKDGKVGTVYDKEFRPLGVDGRLRHDISETEHTSDKINSSQTANNAEMNEKSKIANLDPWPFSGQKPEIMSNKAMNNSTEHAGYKTVPKIQPQQSSLLPQSPTDTPTFSKSSQLEKTERTSTQEAEAKEKNKLCGCCSIM